MRSKSVHAVRTDESWETTLPKDLRKDLIALAHRIVTLAGSRNFIAEDDYPESPIVVGQGCAAKFRLDSGGTRQVLGFASPGEFLLPQGATRRYKISPVIGCTLLIFDRDEFGECLARSEELRSHLAKLACRENLVNQEWLMNFARASATERVAHLICEVGERLDLHSCPDAVFPLTQQQISEIAGQTAVNVNRVLAGLEQEKLVERKGRLRVRDWKGLRELINYDPEYLQCCL